MDINDVVVGSVSERMQNDHRNLLSVKNKKIKKPRFAFQTKSQVDILDDGYRWRKYGQKAVKNNNYPRYVISSFLLIRLLSLRTQKYFSMLYIYITPYVRAYHEFLLA